MTERSEIEKLVLGYLPTLDSEQDQLFQNLVRTMEKSSDNVSRWAVKAEELTQPKLAEYTAKLGIVGVTPGHYATDANTLDILESLLESTVKAIGQGQSDDRVAVYLDKIYKEKKEKVGKLESDEKKLEAWQSYMMFELGVDGQSAGGVVNQIRNALVDQKAFNGVINGLADFIIGAYESTFTLADAKRNFDRKTFLTSAEKVALFVNHAQELKLPGILDRSKLSDNQLKALFRTDDHNQAYRTMQAPYTQMARVKRSVREQLHGQGLYARD